jgi:hypothetical protein
MSEQKTIISYIDGQRFEFPYIEPVKPTCPLSETIPPIIVTRQELTLEEQENDAEETRQEFARQDAKNKLVTDAQEKRSRDPEYRKMKDFFRDNPGKYYNYDA